MSRGFINVLIAYGAPVTREAYLDAAYLGHPPAELDPESEAEMQAQLDEYYGRDEDDEQ